MEIDGGLGWGYNFGDGKQGIMQLRRQSLKWCSKRRLFEIAKMGLLNFIAKITGVEKKVKWSRAKRITVEGPPFFGTYDIYVDNKLDVAIFFPKTDGTVHVTLGTIIGCTRWVKYDSNGSELKAEEFSKGVIDWKINPDRVLFRGRGLPPERRIYEGFVIADEPFTEDITNEWIRGKVNAITTPHKQ